jgi:putative chitinase
MTQKEVLDIAEPQFEKLGWNKRQLAHFISQTAHESGDYKRLEENLNYDAAGLARVWPSRYKDKATGKPNALAVQLSRKPEMIANHTYANRYGNGDVASGDGWKYKGRGIIQCTFKANYAECSKALFNDSNVLINNPELLLVPEHAVNSALWYWKSRNLHKIDDIKALTTKINGGLIGLDDRTKRFNSILSTL